MSQLYDGPDEEAPLMGTFCGNVPPPANSTTSPALTVVFRTDSSVSMPGFQMMWYQNGERKISFIVTVQINNHYIHSLYCSKIQKFKHFL